jgi:PPK2 family polyphosphate:nucleotide phosphotransferase
MGKSAGVRNDREQWRVDPDRFHLDKVDTGSTSGAPGGKAATQATFPDMWDKLQELQERLYAQSEQALLVVLQAMDAGGKDGTIRHVFRGLNPLGVRVAAFKVPSSEEKTHDFLWRIHQQVPRLGEMGVFNRSHYEDVLVARVHDLVPEKVWRDRYEHIRAFESLLASAGTTIVKIMLHVSPDEQRRRLQARVDTPDKRWKFNPADLEERRLWDDYQHAFDEALRETSVLQAPWYCVPADRKWYRNWAVGRILVETLGAMNPQWPEIVDDVEGIDVE